jgi:PAS domain S-box-containing protein
MSDSDPKPTISEPQPITLPSNTIEGREWWLWGFAVLVTMALTLAIIALVYPGSRDLPAVDLSDLRDWVRGLAALVLLFDFYTVYQHLQLSRMRRQLDDRNRLFRMITENAADMIAVVDAAGRRLYNSPAYQRVLGYSPDDLRTISGMDQIHPDDRSRVITAAERARVTGRGEQLEYRIRHKDGSWRILESTASPIRNASGQIEMLVIVNRDITERKHAEQLLEYNALHDGLTQLPNRTLFIRQLEKASAISRRHERYFFAVLLLDIDGFKLINESLGHEAGDELLVQLGGRLKASIRGLDTLARPGLDEVTSFPDEREVNLAKLGGDEYVVLLDDIRHPTDALRVAARLQQTIVPPFQVRGHEVVISASIGIALSQATRIAPQDLLRDAEIAMHRAKQAGKACCQVFDGVMHAEALNRLQIEAELRKGIAENQFQVHYQPIVSLRSCQIVGFEALSRWQKPDRMVMPSEFIDIADETGLIIAINQKLLAEACKRVKGWQTCFHGQLFLSVNIPPKQFADPNFPTDIDSILRDTRFERSTLELEIVETVAMGEPEKATQVLERLKNLGVRLCIDDFGTGYSSLSRLEKLPVHTLKIDRSFVDRMAVSQSGREIVRTIICLAHAIGLRVTAEGVEHQEQLIALKELDCDLAQGYFFSRPVDPDVMSDMLLSKGLDMR